LKIENADMYGLQLELEIDQTALNLVNVSSELDGFNVSNWALDNEGKLRISWSKETLVSSKDIILTFKAQKKAWLSDHIVLGKTIPSEYYSAEYEKHSLELELRGEVLNKEIGLTLGQNKPNPFQTKTIIEYFSDMDEELEFQIMDMSGRIMYADVLYAKSGVNSLELDKNAMNLNVGIYMYSLKSDKKVLTKKMILVD